MSDLYWLTDEQMARLNPYFPKSHGKPHVDDRRVLSGIIFFNRNGLRWRDAPADYGPHKTLYNRWKRWSDAGVFIPDDGGPVRRPERASYGYDRRDLVVSNRDAVETIQRDGPCHLAKEIAQCVGDLPFGPAEFERLNASLKAVRGRFILSLNDVPPVREMFSWASIEAVEHRFTVGGRQTPAREVIIRGGGLC